MANTRKNPRDPDSPFLTRDAFKNAKTFSERFPHLDPSVKPKGRMTDEGYILEFTRKPVAGKNNSNGKCK